MHNVLYVQYKLENKFIEVIYVITCAKTTSLLMSNITALQVCPVSVNKKLIDIHVIHIPESVALVVELVALVGQKQTADSVLVGSLDFLVFPMPTLLFLHCNNKSFLQQSYAQATNRH